LSRVWNIGYSQACELHTIILKKGDYDTSFSVVCTVPFAIPIASFIDLVCSKLTSNSYKNLVLGQLDWSLVKN